MVKLKACTPPFSIARISSSTRYVPTYTHTFRLRHVYLYNCVMQRFAAFANACANLCEDSDTCSKNFRSFLLSVLALMSNNLGTFFIRDRVRQREIRVRVYTALNSSSLESKNRCHSFFYSCFLSPRPRLFVFAVHFLKTCAPTSFTSV